MYAWHKCRLTGAGAEAGLLIELLACQTVMLRGAPDSLDGARGCCCRMGYLLKNIALYFVCKGRSVLFRTKRAFCVSIDSYNPARSWHLELKVCIVRYRIESSERGSSKQCMIATTERDDIED